MPAGPQSDDETFMRRALELARKGWGTTHPNPMVGAVIVEDGQIVAEGFHAKDGEPHAEREALTALGRRPKAGAALVVTVEPCSTQGRTGACTDAIREAGIRRVVAGAADPNPAHAGRGFAVLRQAGVEVTSGVLEPDCADLNLLYNHWTATGGPLLAAKAAVTLDGRVACRTGDSQWITGEEARADVHRWRELFPAIAAGAGTILRDNPRLTVRRAGQPERAPWRFVFDGRLRTVVDRSVPGVYTDEFHERTIVVATAHAGEGYVRKLRGMGVQVWVCPSPTQRVPFGDFRRRCAEAGITGVYFEGGSYLVSQLVIERQLDYFFSYSAPILLADDRAKPMLAGLRTERLARAIRLADVRHERFGDDALCRGRVVYPEKLQIDETTFSLG
ncbi:MAG: bifunctional diaminohydroxyphosphoribosylaminopyrimidine deaminase/5-amino-6-(5-phosphoribosylamino)uracil reductase RibD [Opitutaceae bacterium]